MLMFLCNYFCRLSGVIVKQKFFVALAISACLATHAFAQDSDLSNQPQDHTNLLQEEPKPNCELYTYADSDFPQIEFTLEQLDELDKHQAKVKLASLAKLAMLRVKLHMGKHKYIYLITTGIGFVALASLLANRYRHKK